MRRRRLGGSGLAVSRLALALFCRQSGFAVLSREEFAAHFPDQAKVPGVCHSRYYVDLTHDPPRLCVLVFDFGCSARRLLRRALHGENPAATAEPDPDRGVGEHVRVHQVARRETQDDRPADDDQQLDAGHSDKRHGQRTAAAQCCAAHPRTAR